MPNCGANLPRAFRLALFLSAPRTLSVRYFLPSAPSSAAAFVPSPPPSVSPVLLGPSQPTAESLEPVWRISLGLSPLPMLGLRISPSWHFRVLERWHQSPLCFQLGAYATPSHVPCSAPLLPLAPLSIAAFVNLSSLTWAFVTDLRVSRSSVEDPSRPSLCGFRIRSALPLHQLV
mgnify:CR=1 FL=1